MEFFTDTGTRSALLSRSFLNVCATCIFPKALLSLFFDQHALPKKLIGWADNIPISLDTFGGGVQVLYSYSVYFY